MAITKVSPDVLDLDSGITITTADNTDTLSLISTDADANVGPNLVLYRNSASPADGDMIGMIHYDGENSAGETISYAKAYAETYDITDGTEDGRYFITTMVGGSESVRMYMNFNETVFNESSADVDFRVESDDNTHMLFVDAANDRVGIGTSSPDKSLEIAKTAADGEGGSVVIRNGSSTTGSYARLYLSATANDPSDRGTIIQTENTDGNNNMVMVFKVSAGDAPAEVMRLTKDGQLLLGATAAVDSERMLVNRNGSCKMTVRAEEDSSARDALFSLHTRNTGAQCRINFVDGSGAGSGAGQIYYNHDGNDLIFITDATEVGKFAGNGDFYTNDGTVHSLSDQRLKTNVEDYTYDMDVFKSYQTKMFDWINPEEHGNRSRQIGFIAQEQEAIDSRFVKELDISPDSADTALLDTITKEDGDVRGIGKTSEFNQKDAMYISVIQQLITRLETAEEKIAALENN